MYSAKKWATVKADYETGNFSAEELWKKYGIHQRTIENRIKDEKWVKGKSKPLIAKGIAERNIAMFAKLGMTQEKVAQKLVEGVMLGENAVKELAEYIEENKPSAGDEDEDNAKKDIFFYKQVTNLMKGIVDDRHLSLKYLQELNKMFGTHAPLKRELTGKDDTPLVPSNASKEDLMNMIKGLLPDDSNK